jgi:hypothetical protein
MRKSIKIVSGIAIAVVVVIAGVFVAAFVSVLRNNLPADSARVVETADYRFDAPEGWITACADRAPGCLAVAASSHLWSDREYWIEARPVDTTKVADTDSFVQRAISVARTLVLSAGGKPEQLIHIDDSPVAFEGADLFDVEDTTAPRFSRSRFVRFPDGNVMRFTCYGENNAGDKEHDEACFAALEGLHFPAAAAAEQERLAREQEQRAAEQKRLAREQKQQAADNATAVEKDARDDATFGREGLGSSEPNSPFNMKNVAETWKKTKDLLKDQGQPKK